MRLPVSCSPVTLERAFEDGENRTSGQKTATGYRHAEGPVLEGSSPRRSLASEASHGLPLITCGTHQRRRGLAGRTARSPLETAWGGTSLSPHYEQAAGLESLKRIVVDREGMSAKFLAQLSREGRTIVTVPRTDQYTGVESFREVGEFGPLQADRWGKVIREVALARFSLPLPEHPGQELEVRALERGT